MNNYQSWLWFDCDLSFVNDGMSQKDGSLSQVKDLSKIVKHYFHFISYVFIGIHNFTHTKE